MTIRTAVISLFSVLSVPTLFAEPPEAFRSLWNDPWVTKTIAENIEKYRKGDVSLVVKDASGKRLHNLSLKIEQKTHEFLFGCNLFVLDQLDTPELNAKYEQAFTGLFNCATIPFYWGDLEPQPGKPRFKEGSPRVWRRPPPDRLLRWCKTHSIVPKGHALMYAKNMFMPDWTARNDAELFKKQSQKHMSEIAERYGHEIGIWDVVNEDIPRVLHPKEWHEVSTDFLPWCFEEAAKLFPKNAKLLINDGTEEAHKTTSTYKALVNGLVQRGVRVDGIGIQFHAYNRAGMLNGKVYTPKELYAAYEQLGQLGLPLYITEITIPGTGEKGDELQAAIVENIYRLWFSVPQMQGVTWWNLGDGTAFGNENKVLGGILDKEMKPKASYLALDKLINSEWRTKCSISPDATGTCRLRGFYGMYTVTVEVEGRIIEKTFRLLKDNANNWEIRL